MYFFPLIPPKEAELEDMSCTGSEDSDNDDDDGKSRGKTTTETIPFHHKCSFLITLTTDRLNTCVGPKSLVTQSQLISTHVNECFIIFKRLVSQDSSTCTFLKAVFLSAVGIEYWCTL